MTTTNKRITLTAAALVLVALPAFAQQSSQIRETTTEAPQSVAATEGLALTDEQAVGNKFADRIAAVVNNHCRSFSSRECESLKCAPPVVCQTFAFPSKYCYSIISYCCGCMVLCRIYVAGAPSYFSTEFYQSLYQYSCLYCHVERTHYSGTFQRFTVSVFLTQCHKSGHFVFSHVNFFTAEINKVHVCYFVWQL